MDKPKKQKRLMIDLRWCPQLQKSHLDVGFKKIVIGYYAFLGLLMAFGGYTIVNIAIAKNAIRIAKLEETGSMSQIRELEELQTKADFQIKGANDFIEWLMADIHGQKWIYVLFSKLSKEVVLEKFSFKRDKKNKHKIALWIQLKGSYNELYPEFEAVLSKLDELGLMLISQKQSATENGQGMQLLCQMSALNNNKR